MPESNAARLASIHLEDLSIVALSGRPDTDRIERHPELDDSRRGRLRGRLKQISRHDWPSSLRDDPGLRRGYTLLQLCRLLMALLLLDGHLAPSVAIPLARRNEDMFLRAMAERLRKGIDGHASDRPDDPLVVVLLGELAELVAQDGWVRLEPERVRLLERQELATLWSAGGSMSAAGQRLVVDAGAAAARMWRWLAERRLMHPEERDELIAATLAG